MMLAEATPLQHQDTVVANASSRDSTLLLINGAKMLQNTLVSAAQLRSLTILVSILLTGHQPHSKQDTMSLLLGQRILLLQNAHKNNLFVVLQKLSVSKVLLMPRNKLKLPRKYGLSKTNALIQLTLLVEHHLGISKVSTTARLMQSFLQMMSMFITWSMMMQARDMLTPTPFLPQMV